MNGDNSGVVRRSDVYLRGSFPELKTVIYEIAPNKFLIHCDGLRGDFQEFKDHFDHKIRMITSLVEVSNIIPGSFLRIIPSIPDTEIAKGFEGMLLTKHALLSMLVDKFPSVHFSNWMTTQESSILLLQLFGKRLAIQLIIVFSIIMIERA